MQVWGAFIARATVAVVVLLVNNQVNSKLIKGDFLVSLDNITLTTDPTFITAITESTSAPPNQRISLYLTVHKKAGDHNTFVQQSCYKFNDITNKFDVILLGKRQRFCDVLAKPKLDPYLKITIDLAIKYGFHSLRSCPFAIGTHNVTGFRIDSDGFPSFTPTGRFLVKFHITQLDKNTYKPLLQIETIAHVMRKRDVKH